MRCAIAHQRGPRDGCPSPTTRPNCVPLVHFVGAEAGRSWPCAVRLCDIPYTCFAGHVCELVDGEMPPAPVRCRHRLPCVRGGVLGVGCGDGGAGPAHAALHAHLYSTCLTDRFHDITPCIDFFVTFCNIISILEVPFGVKLSQPNRHHVMSASGEPGRSDLERQQSGVRHRRRCGGHSRGDGAVRFLEPAVHRLAPDQPHRHHRRGFGSARAPRSLSPSAPCIAADQTPPQGPRGAHATAHAMNIPLQFWHLSEFVAFAAGFAAFQSQI